MLTINIETIGSTNFRAHIINKNRRNIYLRTNLDSTSPTHRRKKWIRRNGNVFNNQFLTSIYLTRRYFITVMKFGSYSSHAGLYVTDINFPRICIKFFKT